ncbi:MAG: amidohydrolase family protein [Myxococcota bacterium]|jgi:predicted TIM-barrel fold metal-dependent hydrolase|nr:amidohydrolase family protein [Myxococcota bacterium]
MSLDLDRYLVISSDGHAGLPMEDYREYVDPRFRDAFDAALPIQRAMTESAAKSFLIADINEEWRKGIEDDLAGAWDSDARNRVVDADGVTAEVLFPDGVTEMNAPPFGAGFSLGTQGTTKELQWAGCDAHNRWLSEFVSQAPERRIGLACIPVLWDIDLAVEGIRRAHEDGLRGVVFPPMWGEFAPYHHSRYNPVWEVCQDLDMPIHFHSGPSPIQDYFGPMPPKEGQEINQGAVGIYICEVAIWLARPVTFMLWGGVFENHPRLKVALVEGTGIWVPEYLQLLEQRYSDSHYSMKLGDYRSHLSMSPADYFKRNVRIGASCMPRREADMRNEIGVGTIMWGTDYPHPEGSWPHTKDQLKETFHDLPEQDIAAMLGENAVSFYNLDVEKLAPIVARIGPEKATFQQ